MGEAAVAEAEVVEAAEVVAAAEVVEAAVAEAAEAEAVAAAEVVVEAEGRSSRSGGTAGPARLGRSRTSCHGEPRSHSPYRGRHPAPARPTRHSTAPFDLSSPTGRRR